MPAYLSQKLIDSLTDHTEAFLDLAVSQWQMLPHHRFAFKASPEKWSANQCIAHLNSYGRYYLPEIEKAIVHAEKTNQQPSAHFTAGWLGNYFTRMMLINADGNPAKKMKAPNDHSPLNNTDSSAVIAEFIEQQETLLGLLRRAKSIDLNKIKIPISIAKFIRLRLGDTFLFLVAHHYRHILQAERALGEEGDGLAGFALSDMQ